MVVIQRVISFFVPFPRVPAKARARVVSGGQRTYTPETTRDAEEQILLAYKTAWHQVRDKLQNTPVAFPAGRGVKITVTALYPYLGPKKDRPRGSGGYSGEPGLLVEIDEDPGQGLGALPTKKPDDDNILKLVQDALNGYAWTDDAQITDGRVIKRYV